VPSDWEAETVNDLGSQVLMHIGPMYFRDNLTNMCKHHDNPQRYIEDVPAIVVTANYPPHRKNFCFFTNKYFNRVLNSSELVIFVTCEYDVSKAVHA
jgi:hypothetical protein